MTYRSNASSPRRKGTRLKDYDYAIPGMYFVTICTHRRKALLGDINNGSVTLSTTGSIVAGQIASIHVHNAYVSVDSSVVMPNHIHMIICIHPGNGPDNTLGNILRGFKAGVSRACRRQLWQRSYHDHVIRNEQDLQEIRTYILNNPLKWELDRHNPDNPAFPEWKEPV